MAALPIQHLFAADAPTNTWTTTTGTPANGGIYYQNALVRFTFNSTTGQLGSPVAVCDTLPGGQDHNSQRIIIAPIGSTYYLFYANGDMGAGQFANSARPENAQILDSYEGKILRFNLTRKMLARELTINGYLMLILSTLHLASKVRCGLLASEITRVLPMLKSTVSIIYTGNSMAPSATMKLMSSREAATTVIHW